jgi:hypothetical protein
VTHTHTHTDERTKRFSGIVIVPILFSAAFDLTYRREKSLLMECGVRQERKYLLPPGNNVE